MARIRTIKPSFFRSEDVSALPLRARLTWIGLWTHCDDQGRAKDNARLIKGDLWPLDEVSLNEIEDDLETLAVCGRIVRYEVDGKRYLVITNWSDHQKIQKPTESKIPAPPRNPPPPRKRTRRATGDLPESEPVDNSNSDITAGQEFPEDSGSPTGVLPLGREGNKEGKGRDARASATSPTRCPEHLGHADPPACRACRDARLASEAHVRDLKLQQNDCRLCDGDGWRWDPAGKHRGVTSERCDHQPARQATG